MGRAASVAEDSRSRLSGQASGVCVPRQQALNVDGQASHRLQRHQQNDQGMGSGLSGLHPGVSPA